MVEILMMSAKLATLSLLKLKEFWNKSFHVIISVDDATNKIFSRDFITFLAPPPIPNRVNNGDRKEF